MPVAPDFRLQRRQFFSRLYLADAPAILQQLVLLESDLSIRLQMLQASTAVLLEMSAIRCHPLRPCTQYLSGSTFIIAAMGIDVFKAYSLTWQGSMQKHRFVIDAPHPSSIMAERINFNFMKSSRQAGFTCLLG